MDTKTVALVGAGGVMAGLASYVASKASSAKAAPYAADVEFVLARAAALSGGGRPNLEHLTAALQALPGGPKAAATDGTAGGSGAPGGGDALTKAQLEETMKQLMAPQSGFNPDESALERFCRDLTAEARSGKLDPVVGRDEVLRRAVHILCRRTKNNPCLIGESGVGKTAIVEGLAQRIVANDVPVQLMGTVIMELDLGSLAAGCVMPGEFEERLKAVIDEIGAAPRRTILFIDDIHNLVPNLAQQGSSTMDGGSILKPALSRGELRCIGVTTIDKFKKTIEKDPALERRFQTVTVAQPTVEETVSILRGLRPRYESYHGITVSEAALLGAASLSDRYISGRFLPDKAIDLMDEATAQVKMEVALKPEALDVLDRRVKQLEGEKAALAGKSGADRTAQQCLADLTLKLIGLKAQQKKIRAAVQQERSSHGDLSCMRIQISKLKYDMAQAAAAEDAEDKERAADALSAMQAKLAAAEAALKAPSRHTRLIKDEVTEGDIARVISKWTGIPVAKVVASEQERLLQLTSELHRRIIGQEEAVEAVAEAIQRSRADLSDPNGPIASFMFLGPTGVGKTELAKALAAYLFNSEDALVRLDMSEYMEKHSVSRLIGAPPGYVGYDEGGLLTDAVKRRPYSVVLFDEIEKAHVDVFNVLLQILDDGRVTDTQGHTINFKNTLIIMTSNLGSSEIFQHKVAKGGAASIKEKVMEHVKAHFRPEFINRVDDFITFHPLTGEQIKSIVQLRAQRLIARMADKRMALSLRPAAVDYLAAKGYDPVFGARPVKRALQRELQTLLAKALLRGEYEEDDTVIVDSDGKSLRLLKGDKLVREIPVVEDSEEPEPEAQANGHLAADGDMDDDDFGRAYEYY